MDTNILDTSNLILINFEKSDWIKTDQLEPDSFKRFQKYPFISEIMTEVYFYKNQDGKEIKKTITHRKKTALDIKKEERYNQFKNSKAFNHDSIRTFDKEISIQTKNTDSNKDKNLSKSKTTYTLNKNYETKTNQNTETNDLYIPKNLKNLENTCLNFIIKNIPIYYNKKELQYLLNDLFKSYGLINKISLVTDKTTKKLKDIAFIEFCSLFSGKNILDNSEKKIIDNSILSIEKVKK